MGFLDEYTKRRNIQIAGGLVIGLVIGGITRMKLRQKMLLNQARKKWNEAGKDVVVLHQYIRPKKTINMSPFPAKIETFMRMNKIKYISDFRYPLSIQNKCPWITINGQDVPDSQLGINHLKKLFNINMDSHLSPQEAAVARGIRSLMEDHLYWTVMVLKWDVERGRMMFEQAYVPGGFIGRMRMVIGLKLHSRKMANQAYHHGMARHKLEDVKRMFLEDMKCLSDFLADKPYFTGQKPAELDCVAFGFLSIAMYAPVYSEFSDMAERFPNLKSFVERIKAEFYPDWDEMLKERKKKSTS